MSIRRSDLSFSIRCPDLSLFWDFPIFSLAYSKDLGKTFPRESGTQSGTSPRKWEIPGLENHRALDLLASTCFVRWGPFGFYSVSPLAEPLYSTTIQWGDARAPAGSLFRTRRLAPTLLPQGLQCGKNSTRCSGYDNLY